MKDENRTMLEIYKAEKRKLRNGAKAFATFAMLLLSRIRTVDSSEAVESEWTNLAEFAVKDSGSKNIRECADLVSATKVMSYYRKVAKIDGHQEVRKFESTGALRSRYDEIGKQEKKEKAEKEKEEKAEYEKSNDAVLARAISLLHGTCESLIRENQASTEALIQKIAEFSNQIVSETGKAHVRDLRKPDEVKTHLENKVIREEAEAMNLANA